MLFENQQVDSDKLPRVEDLNFIPLEKQYLKVVLVSTAIFWAFILVAATIVFFLISDEMAPILKTFIPVLLITFCLLSIYMTILGFHKKGYALRQKDIIFKTGLIWQKEIAIPFKRVQHCEVNQGPIERLFSLSNLHVFTAGGSSSDLSIPGLRPDTAQQLKEYIVKKSISDEEE